MSAAVVVAVKIDRKSGIVRVPRVVIAADIGIVVNPDGAGNQLEGGIVQAVSVSLKEQVTFDRCEITSRDWAGYPILTFPEVPSILQGKLGRALISGSSTMPEPQPTFRYRRG